ncbi:MAG: hypothetical protein KKG03_02550 [Gammaproteobacteria bacterium]|nr:hypothetical protein [Sideroxydans sp.]MBU3902718.1 hypothetical protein [Gammaproteobacteria bacterium]MBU4046196.1 hypothetical protein [Gammaproteobacteria bacterium]MBU4150511.1 hypothetical protein [Gammaproteobacteria bacterium]
MGKYLFFVAGWMVSAWVWAAPGANLVGRWDCQGEEGATVLDFRSSDRLVYDGEENSYRIQGNAIMIPGLFGEEAYRFKLKGKNLAVTFPEGETIRCLRAGSTKQKPGKQQAGGNAGALRGRLCQWTGSSSSYSGTSSSRTQSAQFDGQGDLVYSSESSFSSGAGMAYGSGGGTRGVYRVQGDRVLIRLEDGSEVNATVNMRQNDGSITELMINGKLWASGLCE